MKMIKNAKKKQQLYLKNINAADDKIKIFLFINKVYFIKLQNINNKNYLRERFFFKSLKHKLGLKIYDISLCRATFAAAIFASSLVLPKPCICNTSFFRVKRTVIITQSSSK